MNHHHQTMCEWHQTIWPRELLFSCVHSVCQHSDQPLYVQYSSVHYFKKMCFFKHFYLQGSNLKE